MTVHATFNISSAMEFQRLIRYTVLVTILVDMSECTCSRKYTSSQPDCTTARLSNGQSTDTTIPCFVRSGSTGIEQLEFPNDKLDIIIDREIFALHMPTGYPDTVPNLIIYSTQTCYRTCIDASTNQCEATLIDSIHNRDLIVGSDFKLWVFSQGFQRSINQKYRKSSICRYNIHIVSV